MGQALPRFSFVNAGSLDRLPADGGRGKFVKTATGNVSSIGSHAPARPPSGANEHGWEASMETCPSGYRHGGLNWPAIIGAAILQVVCIGALLSITVVANRAKPAERLTVFDVKPQTPTPPPPQPQPVEPVVTENPPIRTTAVPPMIRMPSEVQAALAEVPPQPPVAVALEAPPAPPAPPAPVTPPDFSAAQLNNPGPRYPFQSRRNREEGVVMLRVLVTPSGRAGEVRLERTSGFERLDHAAIKTVRRWRFVPAKQAGKPVSAWVLVPVGFSLS